MKEFEKWLKEISPKCEVPSWFGGAGEGWRGALEWVLSQDASLTAIELTGIIKEELEQ